MEIIAVALNFNDALEIAKDLSKDYDVSTGVKYIIKYGLSSLNPYYKYKDSRWAIRKCGSKNSEYICMTPYEVVCQYYIDKK